MKKICPGCGEERDAEKDFRWKYKDRAIRQRWCKYCQAIANKDHYRNNKQDYLNRALTRNARVNTENRQKLYAYLAVHPCVDCGQTDVRVLEFDHVRGNKSANIARLLKKKKSLNARSAAPTATASRRMKEAVGGDLGEVEKLRVLFLSPLPYHDAQQRAAATLPYP